MEREWRVLIVDYEFPLTFNGEKLCECNVIDDCREICFQRVNYKYIR